MTTGFSYSGVPQLFSCQNNFSKSINVVRIYL